MFQARFGKVDEFGWWDMERIQTDAGTQFIPKDFQYSKTSIRGTRPKENYFPSRSDIANIVNYCTFNYCARKVFIEYKRFAVIYTTDHICSFLPIKPLVD